MGIILLLQKPCSLPSTASLPRSPSSSSSSPPFASSSSPSPSSPPAFSAPASTSSWPPVSASPSSPSSWATSSTPSSPLPTPSLPEDSLSGPFTRCLSEDDLSLTPTSGQEGSQQEIGIGHTMNEQHTNTFAGAEPFN